jgi:hypothetical protein
MYDYVTGNVLSVLQTVWYRTGKFTDDGYRISAPRKSLRLSQETVPTYSNHK